MKLVLLFGDLIILPIAHPVLTAQNQNETPLVPFSSDYRFKDGLYLNIDEVRANDPNSIWYNNPASNWYKKRYFYSYVSAEGKISLFDFESNTLTGYNVESLGVLLERYSVLYSEYLALRKRDRKKRMEEFIRRYIAGHPLYLSGN
jgi:hypothetical protein